MSPSVGSRVVLFGIVTFVAGCSSIRGGGTDSTSVEQVEASPPPATVSLARTKPLDAYVALGGTIKRCWFNAVDPILPGYVYRADVAPDGAKVKITVHTRARAPSLASASRASLTRHGCTHTL